MGYGERKGGGGHKIATFWPDDTDKCFYIAEGTDLAEIMDRCAQKWPDGSSRVGFNAGDIQIEAQFIHTDCLYYDLMDFGDYTRFLCITNTAI